MSFDLDNIKGGMSAEAVREASSAIRSALEPGAAVEDPGPSPAAGASAQALAAWEGKAQAHLDYLLTVPAAKLTDAQKATLMAALKNWASAEGQ